MTSRGAVPGPRRRAGAWGSGAPTEPRPMEQGLFCFNANSPWPVAVSILESTAEQAIHKRTFLSAPFRNSVHSAIDSRACIIKHFASY